MEGFNEMTFNQFKEMVQNLIDAEIREGKEPGQAAMKIMKSFGIKFEPKEKDSPTAAND